MLLGDAGDDVLFGGAGYDQLYGGSGSDTFVIDLNHVEVADEIMDFDPIEGDSILLLLPRSKPKQEDLSADISGGKLEARYQRITINNIRIDNVGDIEVQMDGKTWDRIVRVKQTGLKLRASSQGDKIQLILSKPY